MYLITEFRWSDVAMGDGNPQTRVALRNNLEEAHQFVIALANECDPEDDEGLPMEVKTYEEAIAFLKGAPETPEIDISEVEVGCDLYLKKDVLDDHARLFNGNREIGNR